MVSNCFTEMGITFNDIYPYPTKDAPLWLDLFVKAYSVDREFWSILVYLRSVGCSIVETNNAKMPYKLEPMIGENNFKNMEQWNHEKQYLVPYTNQLVRILRELKDTR